MTTTNITPYVPISWGELIDKITILEIKNNKALSVNAKKNISNELNYLFKICELDKHSLEILILKDKLSAINHALWDIEDKIREKELIQEFDQFFIDLARSVYKFNDERARIKKLINTHLNSELIEEKIYSQLK